MKLKSGYHAGFTLMELLVVVAIIGVLAAMVIANISETREQVYEARTLNEFNTFRIGLELYLQNNNWTYPDDVIRDVPAELSAYLGPVEWPNAPWPDSVYDWDNYIPFGSSERAYQLSVRFCPIGGPLSACKFPDEPWAENFGINSSYFYCIDGACQAHPAELPDYPGYCANCTCKQMEDC